MKRGKSIADLFDRPEVNEEEEEEEDTVVRIQRKGKKKPKGMLQRLVVEEDDDLHVKITAQVGEDEDEDEDDKYEDDDISKQNGRIAFLKSREKNQKQQMEILKKIIQEDDLLCKNIPSYYGPEIGDIDTSGAFVIEVDPCQLNDKSFYPWVLNFLCDVRSKSAHRLWTHPGDPRDGGLGVIFDGGDFPEDDYHFLEDLANSALDEYNKRCKVASLKLEQIKRVTFRMGGCFLYYITFTAVDEISGYSSTYQAAVQDVCDQRFVGLLRDSANDKALVILHPKGSGDNLDALRRLIPC